MTARSSSPTPLPGSMKRAWAIWWRWPSNWAGRPRPDIKLGLLRRDGGDPGSIAFCHRAGLTYVLLLAPTACPSRGWPPRRPRLPTPESSEQTPLCCAGGARLRRVPPASARSVAPPLRVEPALLGFDAGFCAAAAALFEETALCYAGGARLRRVPPASARASSQTALHYAEPRPPAASASSIRPLRCSSSPNETRCAGLSFGFAPLRRRFLKKLRFAALAARACGVCRQHPHARRRKLHSTTLPAPAYACAGSIRFAPLLLLSGPNPLTLGFGPGFAPLRRRFFLSKLRCRRRVKSFRPPFSKSLSEISIGEKKLYTSKDIYA